MATTPTMPPTATIQRMMVRIFWGRLISLLQIRRDAPAGDHAGHHEHNRGESETDANTYRPGRQPKVSLAVKIESPGGGRRRRR